MKRTPQEAEKEIKRLKKIISDYELKKITADEKILRRNMELADELLFFIAFVEGSFPDPSANLKGEIERAKRLLKGI